MQVGHKSLEYKSQHCKRIIQSCKNMKYYHQNLLIFCKKNLLCYFPKHQTRLLSQKHLSKTGSTRFKSLQTGSEKKRTQSVITSIILQGIKFLKIAEKYKKEAYVHLWIRDNFSPRLSFIGFVIYCEQNFLLGVVGKTNIQHTGWLSPKQTQKLKSWPMNSLLFSQIVAIENIQTFPYQKIHLLYITVEQVL